MADIIKITDGTNELHLNASDFSMIADGASFGIAEHNNQYHNSPWQEGKYLVRSKMNNRQWEFSVASEAGSDSDVAKLLNELSRFSYSARRYYQQDDVDKFQLYIQLDGLNNPTYYDIVDISYDGISIFNWFNRSTQDLIFDDGLQIVIETEPIGYGEEITLCNELGTPHFEKDSNDNGLADQWNKIGAPTTSIDTTNYICGSQSQKVEFDASSKEGIQSDAVDVDGGKSIVGYAWVYSQSSDEITAEIEEYDGSTWTSVSTSTYSSASETKTGNNGNTWKRIEISSNISASSTQVRFSVYRDSGDASESSGFFVDQSYLQVGVSKIPTGWVSSKHLYSYEEPNTEGTVTYLDIQDLAGDYPVYPDIYIKGITDLRRLFLAASSRKNIAKNTFYFESPSLSGGSGTEVSDSSRSNNFYKTVDVSGETEFSYYFNVGNNLEGPILPLICFKTSTSADVNLITWSIYNEFNFSDSKEYFNVYETIDYESPDYDIPDLATNEWRITPLPPIHVSNQQDSSWFEDAGSGTDVTPRAGMSAKYSGASGTHTFNLDFITYWQIDNGYFICQPEAFNFSTYYGILKIPSDKDDMIEYRLDDDDDSLVRFVRQEAGARIKIVPSRFNRIFAMHEIYKDTIYDHQHACTKMGEFEITYRPRTDLILGDYDNQAEMVLF